MNLNENILYLAQSSAKHLYPKRLEEINKLLPYIHIYKNSSNKLDIEAFNYAQHDNAGRMDIIKYYFKFAIFPNITRDISGHYNIELHDSYTYLEREKNYARDMYNGVLTFSKFKKHSGPVLLPDPYMITNWYGRSSNIQDHVNFGDKLNKACFYGTTTGNRRPLLNERIKICLWAVDKKKYCDFKITNIAQMSQQDIIKDYSMNDFLSIYNSTPVSMEQQMKYKYNFIMDGNTCKFDVWNYNTNSLTLKYFSDEMLWYYPLLCNKYHFVECKDKDSIINNITYYNNNTKEAEFIIHNSKNIYNDLFTIGNHMQYTTALFENMIKN